MCGADTYVMAPCIKDPRVHMEIIWSLQSDSSELSQLGCWSWGSLTSYVHNVCVVTFIWWERRVKLMHASQLSDKLGRCGSVLRDIYC